MEEISRKRLLAIWNGLDPASRQGWLQYGEFLLANVQPAPLPLVEPDSTPGPEGESAIQALKRLRKSYAMMDISATLLDEAAQLMTRRIFGASDAEIIPQMAALFQSHYRQWCASRQGTTPGPATT